MIVKVKNNMKRVWLMLVMVLCMIMSVATPTVDRSKLSGYLVELLSCEGACDRMNASGSSRGSNRVMALVALNEDCDVEDVFERYGCVPEDKVGRVYIVWIPLNRLASMSLDDAVERIEAERMPRNAMDVSHGYVNSSDVYEGVNLPHAFRGEGVVSGIFDSFYDFTHPAFYDESGKLRVEYYYDFKCENENGTMGRAWDSPDEIEELEHSQNTYNQSHGTHVAGIMAGSAVNGKYMGMAPESDIYLVDFNSDRADFESSEHTSATAVLGFKRIFDRAASEGKPCVVNFSSCESVTIARQRILEGEALSELVGPGKIIVAAAGNMGHNASYMEKPADVYQAGVGIVNGVGGGAYIDVDIVTPGNQRVRFDFLGVRLTGSTIEGTLSFTTDSIDGLRGDTCVLHTTVSMGEVQLKVYKSSYSDSRGDVYHVDGLMPNMAYLMLCGATCLLTGDSPAWLYSDLFYSPFVNIDGVPEYSYASDGYSVSWPATLPFIVAVGATDYNSVFTNLDGEVNDDMLMFEADDRGEIAKFSSKGPTFDGLIKPDVVAPGMNIKAAYNSFSADYANEQKSLVDKVERAGKDYYYMAQSGTSMASPIVAGAVALWLQANPNLTPSDVLEVLSHCCTHPDADMTYPNSVYGHGQIDVYKGLLYVLGALNSVPSLYDYQPRKARFVVSDNELRVVLSEGCVVREEAMRVLIYDLNGVLVKQSCGSLIDISQLPEGVYVVQLDTGSVEATGSTLIRVD